MSVTYPCHGPAPVPAERRPLREIFPTSNGHRLQPCPFCGTPTPANADGLRTCHRRDAHGPDCMFPGRPVSW